MLRDDAAKYRNRFAFPVFEKIFVLTSGVFYILRSIDYVYHALCCWNVAFESAGDV